MRTVKEQKIKDSFKAKEDMANLLPESKLESYTFDELNLVDMPLAIFGEDLLFSEQKERTHQIRVRNRINGHPLNGYVKINYLKDDDISSLGDYDEDVLLALISLASDKYFASQTMLFKSRNEILDKLQWQRNNFYYKRLDGALKRLAGILIETDIFFNKMIGVYEKRIFHLIDRISSDRKIFNNSKNVRKQGVYAVEIVWSSTLFVSLTSKYLRPLNFSLYLKIKNPASKKLYRVLDKRLYKTTRCKIPLEYLAINILGIHPSRSSKEMSKMIKKYADELIKVGYLKVCIIDMRNSKNMIYFFKSLHGKLHRLQTLGEAVILLQKDLPRLRQL
jgi:hypothetical protein